MVGTNNPNGSLRNLSTSQNLKKKPRIKTAASTHGRIHIRSFCSQITLSIRKQQPPYRIRISRHRLRSRHRLSSIHDRADLPSHPTITRRHNNTRRQRFLYGHNRTSHRVHNLDDMQEGPYTYSCRGFPRSSPKRHIHLRNYIGSVGVGFSNHWVFATIFAVTQIPLAITEGILAVFIFEFLLKYTGQILSALKVIRSPIAGASERQFQLKKKHYAILIAVLLTLFITPLIFISTDMAGTDDLAEEIISMTGYQPWFDPVLTLPEEFETPLFALQALIGASIITYFVLRTRRRDSSRPGKRKPRHSQDEGHSNLSGHIDSYAHTNSLAKNSPTTKILFALSMLVLSVLSPSPVVPLTMFIVAVVLLIGVAQIPGRFILDLLTYPLAFAGVSCVFIALFFGYGATLAQVTFPWFTWTVYGNGITLAVATFFRVLGAISAMFLLVLTTSMTDLFISLRKAHMPKVLIEISLLVYRYIFVFMEVAARMTTAQKLRLGQTSWLRRIRSTSLIAVNLFIRTMEQGERTFVAMNARGYDGNIRLLDDQPKPSRLAIAGIVVFNILFALVALNIIQIWSL
jgi:cobalt/nickel transport system permease protein